MSVVVLAGRASVQARLDIVDTGFPNDAPPIRIVVMTPRKASRALADGTGVR